MVLLGGTTEIPRGISEASGISQTTWKHTDPGGIGALQVIYKVAERCNINCTYCYYFNMGENSALSRPAYSSKGVTAGLAHWIAQGCQELEIPTVKLAFHGGEPTMIGLKAFEEACQEFRDIVGPVARLFLSIQTNGMLLNDEWIDLFGRYQVDVGVSIDGHQSDNDRFRLDHRGRSTFAHTENAILRLVEAHKVGGPMPSTISVLHHDNDYRATYRYLRGLGIQQMRFLFPDRNADDADFIESNLAERYGQCLSDIFDEWLKEDNLAVDLKFFDHVLAHFSPDVEPDNFRRNRKKNNQIVIAHSDGTVAVDDTFIPALDWYKETPTYNTKGSTLRNFLDNSIFDEIESVTNAIPDACLPCRWRSLCRGGDIENRYSKTRHFNNPSVYCKSYKLLFSDICDKLIANGYPKELIERRFGGE